MSAIENALKAQMAHVQAFRHGAYLEPDGLMLQAEKGLLALQNRQANAQKTLEALVKKIEDMDPYDVLKAQVGLASSMSQTLREENDTLTAKLQDRRVALQNARDHKRSLKQQLQELQKMAPDAQHEFSLAESLVCSTGELSITL